MTLAAGCLCLLAGCTRAPPERSVSPPEEARTKEATVEVGTAPGPLAVTLVLDPAGVLCAAAVRYAAGKRHVICDRTAEDLSAATLKRGLIRLKSEHGAAVAPTDTWLLAAPLRAAVARSLATADPAFFSRVAVWVGESQSTASLFGPTFLASAPRRVLQTVVLLGPGALEAEVWSSAAERQGVRLRVLADSSPGGEAAVWASLAGELGTTLAPP